MTHHVVSFSGGLSSAMTAIKVREAHPDAELVFMDTGAEHPNTYRFIRDFSQQYDLPITCLRGVPDPKMGKGVNYEVVSLDDIGPDLVPWANMVAKYGHPYVGGAFCTDRMKKRPFEKYCDAKYGRGNYTRWIGIRADEPRRLTRKSGYSYLADICDFTKSDVREWWSNQPVSLELPEHLGNCVFCIKKNIGKLVKAIHDEPDMGKDFIDMLDTHDYKEDRIMYRGKQTLLALFKFDGEAEEPIVSDSQPECGEECGILSDEGDLSMQELPDGGLLVTSNNADFVITPFEGGVSLYSLSSGAKELISQFDNYDDALEEIRY